jgi:hypothetical protein
MALLRSLRRMRASRADLVPRIHDSHRAPIRRDRYRLMKTGLSPGQMNANRDADRLIVLPPARIHASGSLPHGNSRSH